MFPLNVKVKKIKSDYKIQFCRQHPATIFTTLLLNLHSGIDDYMYVFVYDCYSTMYC